MRDVEGRRNKMRSNDHETHFCRSIGDGLQPGFARGGLGHGGGFANRGGFVRDPSTLLGSPAPQTPAFENRIPAPLAAPTQPPVINGPLARSPYGGVM
jgi:hypothetical protein